MNTPAESTTSDALAAILSELYGRINYERQVKVSPDEFRLQTMRQLLERLGNPHLDYPIVHVAGTKGKGSVSTMCGSILTAAGRRTGVYTSPHLETIHQRMAIDGQLISDAQLLANLKTILPVVAAMDAEADPATDPTLTFFEITTAAAMLHFAQQNVDYAVLEVGLGGRMDSTNVCQPAVCVITNISLDHTRQLGKTIERIAREKAGIIKQGVPVISGAADEEAAAAIANVAESLAAPLFELDRQFHVQDLTAEHPDENPDVPTIGQAFSFQGELNDRVIDMPELVVGLPGAHQRSNAALAIAAISMLEDRDGQPLADATAIQRGLRQTRLSGRMEKVNDSPLVILDIAHKPRLSGRFGETLATEVPAWPAAKRRILIFATSRDKDAAGMLSALAPQSTQLWLTEYQTNPRAYPLEKLITVATAAGVGESAPFTAAEPAAAWEAVAETLGPQDAVCIAGSAFLVAELRPIVLEWADSH